MNFTEQRAVRGLCPQVQVKPPKICIAGKIKRTKGLVCSDVNKDNNADRSAAVTSVAARVCLGANFFLSRSLL